MESCVWCYITTGCIMLLIQNRSHPPAISCLTALGGIDYMLDDMCNSVSHLLMIRDVPKEKKYIQYMCI